MQDMVMFDGPNLAKSFLKTGFLDEVRIYLDPVAIALEKPV